MCGILRPWPSLCLLLKDLTHFVELIFKEYVKCSSYFKASPVLKGTRLD